MEKNTPTDRQQPSDDAAWYNGPDPDLFEKITDKGAPRKSIQGDGDKGKKASKLHIEHSTKKSKDLKNVYFILPGVYTGDIWHIAAACILLKAARSDPKVEKKGLPLQGCQPVLALALYKLQHQEEEWNCLKYGQLAIRYLNNLGVPWVVDPFPEGSPDINDYMDASDDERLDELYKLQRGLTLKDIWESDRIRTNIGKCAYPKDRCLRFDISTSIMMQLVKLLGIQKSTQILPEKLWNSCNSITSILHHLDSPKNELKLLDFEKAAIDKYGALKELLRDEKNPDKKFVLFNYRCSKYNAHLNTRPEHYQHVKTLAENSGIGVVTISQSEEVDEEVAAVFGPAIAICPSRARQYTALVWHLVATNLQRTPKDERKPLLGFIGLRSGSIDIASFVGIKCISMEINLLDPNLLREMNTLKWTGNEKVGELVKGLTHNKIVESARLFNQRPFTSVLLYSFGLTEILNNGETSQELTLTFDKPSKILVHDSNTNAIEEFEVDNFLDILTCNRGFSLQEHSSFMSQLNVNSLLGHQRWREALYETLVDLRGINLVYMDEFLKKFRPIIHQNPRNLHGRTVIPIKRRGGFKIKISEPEDPESDRSRPKPLLSNRWTPKGNQASRTSCPVGLIIRISQLPRRNWSRPKNYPRNPRSYKDGRGINQWSYNKRGHDGGYSNTSQQQTDRRRDSGSRNTKSRNPQGFHVQEDGHHRYNVHSKFSHGHNNYGYNPYPSSGQNNYNQGYNPYPNGQSDTNQSYSTYGGSQPNKWRNNEKHSNVNYGQANRERSFGSSGTYRENHQGRNKGKQEHDEVKDDSRNDQEEDLQYKEEGNEDQTETPYEYCTSYPPEGDIIEEYEIEDVDQNDTKNFDGHRTEDETAIGPNPVPPSESISIDVTATGPFSLQFVEQGITLFVEKETGNQEVYDAEGFEENDMASLEEGFYAENPEESEDSKENNTENPEWVETGEPKEDDSFYNGNAENNADEQELTKTMSERNRNNKGHE